MREENVIQGLEGICGNCSTKQDIGFRIEFNDIATPYQVGTCPGCKYEFFIPIDMTGKPIHHRL